MAAAAAAAGEAVGVAGETVEEPGKESSAVKEPQENRQDTEVSSPGSEATGGGSLTDRVRRTI